MNCRHSGLAEMLIMFPRTDVCIYVSVPDKRGVLGGVCCVFIFDEDPHLEELFLYLTPTP